MHVFMTYTYNKQGLSGIRSIAFFPNKVGPTLDNKPQIITAVLGFQNAERSLISTADTRGRLASQALISGIRLISRSDALTLSHGRSPVKYNAWNFLAGTRLLSTKLVAPIVKALCLESAVVSPVSTNHKPAE